jgi:succinyl-CoA synthetase beta subunit
VKIHEYQAKDMLRQFAVAVPRGEVCFTPKEAAAVASRLGPGPFVVKAQIHAGGRGKAGGVKIAQSVAEVESLAGQMLGMTLVTPQTGSEGKRVKRLLVEEGLKIASEAYLGVVLDRAQGMPVMMASSEGGVDIEEVARRSPEKILRTSIRPGYGLQPFQARRLAYGLGLGAHADNALKLMTALVRTFLDTDASMAEINPLIVTQGGDLNPR